MGCRSPELWLVFCVLSKSSQMLIMTLFFVLVASLTSPGEFTSPLMRSGTVSSLAVCYTHCMASRYRNRVGLKRALFCSLFIFSFRSFATLRLLRPHVDESPAEELNCRVATIDDPARLRLCWHGFITHNRSYHLVASDMDDFETTVHNHPHPASVINGARRFAVRHHGERTELPRARADRKSTHVFSFSRFIQPHVWLVRLMGSRCPSASSVYEPTKCGYLSTRYRGDSHHCYNYKL